MPLARSELFPRRMSRVDDNVIHAATLVMARTLCDVFMYPPSAWLSVSDDCPVSCMLCLEAME